MWVKFSAYAKEILRYHYRLISNKNTSKKTAENKSFVITTVYGKIKISLQVYDDTHISCKQKSELHGHAP